MGYFKTLKDSTSYKGPLGMAGFSVDYSFMNFFSGLVGATTMYPFEANAHAR